MLEQAFHHFYYNNFYVLGALGVSLMMSYVLKYRVIPNINSTSTNGWRNKVVADNFKRIFNLFAIFLVVLTALRIIITIGTLLVSIIGALVSSIGAVVAAFIVLLLFYALFRVFSSPFTALFFWWFR